MNRLVNFAAAGLVMSAGLAISASAQAPASDNKIVMISFNAAVLQTSEAKTALAAVETKLTPRQTALKTLNNEVETLGKDLQAKASTLTEAERNSRQRTLADKQRQLQRDAQDLKQDIQTEEQQVYGQVAQKMYAFLQTYGGQHGYTLIVERGSDQAPVIWYSAPQIDITAEVVKAYDAAPPSSTPAAPAPAAAKPTAKPH